MGRLSNDLQNAVAQEEANNLKSLEKSIDKLKVINPAIDSAARDYLILKYSEVYKLKKDYFDYETANRHITVACLKFTESVQLANPFE